MVRVWLTGVLNFVVDVEQVPACLKQGITIPIHRGGCKDPFDVNSYTGITLNLVISKVLESLILVGLKPLFMEADLQHPNLSDYRKRLSCADGIFATQEVICRCFKEGRRMYVCAFIIFRRCSTEFPVLLKTLFNAGVDSKTWLMLHKLSKRSMRGTTFAFLICSWPRCATRVHFVTCFVVPGH